MVIYLFCKGLTVLYCCPGKDDHGLDFALFKYLFLHPLFLLYRIGEEVKFIVMLLFLSIFKIKQFGPREQLYSRVETIDSVDKRLIRGRGEQDTAVYQHVPEAD